MRGKVLLESAMVNVDLEQGHRVDIVCTTSTEIGLEQSRYTPTEALIVFCLVYPRCGRYANSSSARLCFPCTERPQTTWIVELCQHNAYHLLFARIYGLMHRADFKSSRPCAWPTSPTRCRLVGPPFLTTYDFARRG